MTRKVDLYLSEESQNDDSNCSLSANVYFREDGVLKSLSRWDNYMNDMILKKYSDTGWENYGQSFSFDGITDMNMNDFYVHIFVNNEDECNGLKYDFIVRNMLACGNHYVAGQIFDSNFSPLKGVLVEDIGNDADLSNENGEFMINCSFNFDLNFSLDSFYDHNIKGIFDFTISQLKDNKNIMDLGKIIMKKILPGDLNGDQKVDSADFEIPMQILSGQTPENFNPAGDTNGDGIINFIDAFNICKIINGAVSGRKCVTSAQTERTINFTPGKLLKFTAADFGNFDEIQIVKHPQAPARQISFWGRGFNSGISPNRTTLQISNGKIKLNNRDGDLAFNAKILNTSNWTWENFTAKTSFQWRGRKSGGGWSEFTMKLTPRN